MGDYTIDFSFPSGPTTTNRSQTFVKTEGSLEPPVLLPPPPPPSTPIMPPPTVSALPSTPTSHPKFKDPENFMRRCSAFKKKGGARCSAVIGKHAFELRKTHPNYLPTCYVHQDQRNLAGFCQSNQNGEYCSRIFRLRPGELELCSWHNGQWHPDTPCYFFQLPVEMRLEIYRYLLPDRAITSSTASYHAIPDDEPLEFHTAYTASSRRRSWSANTTLYEQKSLFKVPLLNLLLLNRQAYKEVKPLLYSTVPFVIDIRKDGTFMCGRRLLAPMRADGSSQFHALAIDNLKEKFIRTFAWSAVQNYDIDILVENGSSGDRPCTEWDEEVEMYDIRDYIGVVVSGILAKSERLNRLNVRLGLHKFRWSEEELLTNTQTLLGPFERLRCVSSPCLVGIYADINNMRSPPMMTLPLPNHRNSRPGVPGPGPPPTPICSIPPVPTDNPFAFSDKFEPAFIKYRTDWQRCISSESSATILPRPPICAMFTEFKNFYTHLEALLPDLLKRQGKHGFLHRARVAREQENVEAFRLIRNDLIECWYGYLEAEDKKRDSVNSRMSKLLDVDIYPSPHDGTRHLPSAPVSSSSSDKSPVVLNMQAMQNDGTLPQSVAGLPFQQQTEMVENHTFYQQQHNAWQQQRRKHRAPRNPRWTTQGPAPQPPHAPNALRATHSPPYSANVPPDHRQFRQPQHPPFASTSNIRSTSTINTSSPPTCSSLTPTLSSPTGVPRGGGTPPTNPVRLGSDVYHSFPFGGPSVLPDAHHVTNNGGERNRYASQACATAPHPAHHHNAYNGESSRYAVQGLANVHFKPQAGAFPGSSSARSPPVKGQHIAHSGESSRDAVPGFTNAYFHPQTGGYPSQSGTVPPPGAIPPPGAVLPPDAVPQSGMPPHMAYNGGEPSRYATAPGYTNLHLSPQTGGSPGPARAMLLTNMAQHQMQAITGFGAPMLIPEEDENYVDVFKGWANDGQRIVEGDGNLDVVMRDMMADDDDDDSDSDDDDHVAEWVARQQEQTLQEASSGDAGRRNGVRKGKVCASDAEVVLIE